MPRYTVRWGHNGMVLGVTTALNLDNALERARRLYRMADLTVDEGPPTQPARARIRYLDESLPPALRAWHDVPKTPRRGRALLAGKGVTV